LGTKIPYIVIAKFLEPYGKPEFNSMVEKFPTYYGKPCVHNSPLLEHILSQLNPVQTLKVFL
jgi:hypothetical protein